MMTDPSARRADSAVLLVNLGTPEAPTAPAVRRYLAEFLGDPRVVQIPRWLWWPLLHGVILPLRAPKAARKYAQIWMDGGSPLLVHTRALAEAVQARLPQTRVAFAMRYGEPTIRGTLLRLRGEGINRVLVLPLYPQYSTTTTASVADAVAAARSGLTTRLVEQYAEEPAWIAALAASIRAHWAEHGRGERLLLSYHGIPQRVADAGDPYPRQCEATTAALTAALEVPRGFVLHTYQSRFGKEAWLQPYTDRTLERLAGEGVRTVDVACPGFAVDCLETLEEIAVENAALFRARGGEALRYIPCLNAAPAHADALAELARRTLDGWR